MSFTDDPQNSIVDRLRLLTGDVDNNDILLSNDVYEYIISENTVDDTLNINAATIQAIRAIVKLTAKFTTEKSGGEFAKWEVIHKQYLDLLKRAIGGGPDSLLNVGLPYAGGISVQDICDNIYDLDSNRNPFGYVKRRTFGEFRGYRSLIDY